MGFHATVQGILNKDSTTKPEGCSPCTLTTTTANSIQDTCVACPSGNCFCNSGSYMQELFTVATNVTTLQCRLCPKGYYTNGGASNPIAYFCEKCPLKGQIFSALASPP